MVSSFSDSVWYQVFCYEMNQKIVTMMESPVSTSRNFLKLGACSVQHTFIVFSVVCRFRKTYGAHYTPPVLKSYSSFNNSTNLQVLKLNIFLLFSFFPLFPPTFQRIFNYFSKKFNGKKLFNSNEIFNCLACIQFDCSSKSHIALNENTGLPSHDQDSLPSTLAESNP